MSHHPDPYANTSLEEEHQPIPSVAAFYSMPLPLPSRGRAQRAIDAATARIRRQLREGARREQQNARRAEQDAKFEASADRRYHRLEEHRKKEDKLNSDLKTALTQWKEKDSAAFEKFSDHARHAVAASSTPVRRNAILLWYSSLPLEVNEALTSLVKHYHGESYLQDALERAEMPGIAPDRRRRYSEEIYYASKRTEIQLKGCHDIKISFWAPYGPVSTAFSLACSLGDLARFEDPYTKPGQEAERIEHLNGNFQIRKYILEDNRRMGLEAMRRYLLKDEMVLEWCKKANHALLDRQKVHILNAPGISKATMRLVAKTQNEIADTIDRITAYLDQVKALNTLITEQLQKKRLYAKEANEGQQNGFAAVKVKAEFDHIIDQLKAFEAKEGQGALRNWRQYT